MHPVAGIDVSKEFVEVAFGGHVIKVKRAAADLKAHFAGFPDGTRIVLEATGRYHRIVLEVAADLRLEARQVDPFVFSLYRKSASPRAKNDRLDALTLQRYGEREWDTIRCGKPRDPRLQRLKDLIELRETQVNIRVAWEQSMNEFQDVPKAAEDAARGMKASIDALDKQILALVKDDELYSLFLEMDGVGPQLAPALVWLFEAFDFQDPDEVVAFVGLDVRVRESGRYIGQRKLTKRGPAFIRRLLHCAANSQRRIKGFENLFARHHQKGLKTKGVNVILGRKLLRAALAIAKTKTRYERAKFLGAT
ncbi:MAG TPA: transposase [Fimbriimonas sp.]|nr:transposase [Fimbriimonas sp.]